jgi:acyl-CoA thioester hydrolase
MNTVSNQTTYRVIYGDTDQMGVAYYANYLRWFEIGRNELLRSVGLPYTEIERREVLLPVSEACCKYISSVCYDDEIVIETSLDPSVRSGLKIDYVIYRKADMQVAAKGHTLHACLGKDGRVIRPPAFITKALKGAPKKAED